MNQYVTIFACGAKGGTQISLVILNQGNKHHHYSLVMCDIRKRGCFTDARTALWLAALKSRNYQSHSVDMPFGGLMLCVDAYLLNS